MSFPYNDTRYYVICTISQVLSAKSVYISRLWGRIHRYNSVTFHSSKCCDFSVFFIARCTHTIVSCASSMNKRYIVIVCVVITQCWLSYHESYVIITQLIVQSQVICYHHSVDRPTTGHMLSSLSSSSYRRSYVIITQFIVLPQVVCYHRSVYRPTAGRMLSSLSSVCAIITQLIVLPQVACLVLVVCLWSSQPASGMATLKHEWDQFIAAMECRRGCWAKYDACLWLIRDSCQQNSLNGCRDNCVNERQICMDNCNLND